MAPVPSSWRQSALTNAPLLVGVLQALDAKADAFQLWNGEDKRQNESKR